MIYWGVVHGYTMIMMIIRNSSDIVGQCPITCNPHSHQPGAKIAATAILSLQPPVNRKPFRDFSS